MSSKYVTEFYTLAMINEGLLAAKLEAGWEIVSLVPFRMVPGDKGTIVEEYLVALRQI